MHKVAAVTAGRHRSKTFAGLIAGVLTLSVALAGCGGSSNNAGGQGTNQPAAGNTSSGGTIKIGIQGPISGQYAIEGQGFVSALTMLADDINTAGGVNGHNIEIVQADDKGDPKEASLAAQKLISAKVVAVVGAYNSTATEAAQGAYDEAGIVMISPSSTNTKLTQKGLKLFLRTATLDDNQAEFAANYLVKTMGKKNIAVIHDNTTYAKGLADWMKKSVEAGGGKVVFFDAITPGDKDFNAILTNVKGKNPDAIYFTGYFSDGGLLVKQARDLGINAVFMAGDANNNPDFVKVAGLAAAKGAMVTTPPLPQDLQDPGAKQFVDKYKAKYGQMPPSVWTIAAVDAFRVIVEALKQTKSTDGKALADFLHKLKNFSGYTGSITFDEKGDRVGTLHTAYVVDDKGNFVPAK